MLRESIVDCISCPNDNCLIKKHCKDEAAQKKLEQKNTILCRKTQNIIIEGSPIHSLYFVQKGKVKVLNTGINGREQILRIANQGEMIGQRGFSTSQQYPIGAIAIEDSTICSFSITIIQELLQKIPSLSYDFMLFYAEELNRSETKVRMFAHMTVREKVIDALLYMNRKFGQKDGYLLIKLSRKEIADFAGTTEEQVIRVISALKKDKLLQATGKKIGITNVESLRREIDEHHFFIQS